MKKILFLIIICNSSLIYSQMSVVDPGANASLADISLASKTTVAKMAEQVGTASLQLSQLEKTYETIRKAADKVEKISNAVQSYSNFVNYVSKQSKIIRNLQELSELSKKPLTAKRIKNLIHTTSSSLKSIQSFLTNDYFNMSDKERMDLIEKENEKLDQSLLLSTVYLNSAK